MGRSTAGPADDRGERENAIRRFVAERLEKLREAGGGCVVAELFKPLPSFVVAHYLGVPEEDRCSIAA